MCILHCLNIWTTITSLINICLIKDVNNDSGLICSIHLYQSIMTPLAKLLWYLSLFFFVVLWKCTSIDSLWLWSISCHCSFNNNTTLLFSFDLEPRYKWEWKTVGCGSSRTYDEDSYDSLQTNVGYLRKSGGGKTVAHTGPWSCQQIPRKAAVWHSVKW